MALTVVRTDAGHRLEGDGDDVVLANRFLDHLTARGFAAATVRAYAFDTLSFLRFCGDHRLLLAEIVPTDVFDFLDWLGRPRSIAGQRVVPLSTRRGAAPARPIVASPPCAACSSSLCLRVLEPIARCPQPAGRPACGPSGEACSATS